LSSERRGIGVGWSPALSGKRGSNSTDEGGMRGNWRLCFG